MADRPDLHTAQHTNFDAGGYCNELVLDSDQTAAVCGFKIEFRDAVGLEAGDDAQAGHRPALAGLSPLPEAVVVGAEVWNAWVASASFAIATTSLERRGLDPKGLCADDVDTYRPMAEAALNAIGYFGPPAGFEGQNPST